MMFLTLLASNFDAYSGNTESGNHKNILVIKNIKFFLLRNCIFVVIKHKTIALK